MAGGSGFMTTPDTYERYIGRWSRMIVPKFLAFVSARPKAAWLDVGCGTGALVRGILDRCDPLRIEAVDLSSAFLDAARAAIADRRVRFATADACSLPYERETFDAVVSGLVLNAVSDQTAALSEFTRAAVPGGVVGVYVWDFDREMQMLRYFWEAATALDPHADEPDPSNAFAICKPDRLAEALRNVGLERVTVEAIDAVTHFRDFDDYWAPFLRGAAPGPAYVASLTPERRDALRERLYKLLPIAGDGSIPLIARAWAARGVKQARG